MYLGIKKNTTLKFSIEEVIKYYEELQCNNYILLYERHLIYIRFKLKKQSQEDEDRKRVIEKELKDIEKQIGNIVMAITNGFIQGEFQVKMEELKERKVYLEGKLVDIEANQSITRVTEEGIRGLLIGFKEYSRVQKFHTRLC